MRSIQILFMYIWLDCEMKKMSLLELLDRIVRNSEKVPYITPDKYNLLNMRRMEKKINGTLKKIDFISTIYFGKAKCLHRAIVEYIFLRKKYHFPVKIIIGVKKFPFEAHAWIAWIDDDFPDGFEEKENIVGYQVIFDSTMLMS